MAAGLQTRKPQKFSDEIDIGSFIREIRIHRKYFLIAALLFLTLAFVYIRFTSPVYRAVSSVLIQDNSKPSAKDLDDILSGNLFGEQENIATQMGVLTSRAVMQEVVNQLGLQVNYFNTSSLLSQPIYRQSPFTVTFDSLHTSFFNIPFDVNIINDREFKISTECDDDFVKNYEFSSQARFDELIQTPYFKIRLSLNKEIMFNPEEPDFRFVINSPSKSISLLLENLKVQTLNKDASIVVMTYDDNVKQRALDILNTIGKAYIDLDVKDKAAVASLTLKFVDDQLENTTRQLDEIERELQNFKEKNKTVDLSTESKAMLDKISAIESDRLKSQIESASLENLLDYVMSNKDMSQLAPSSLGLPDPLLVQLIQTYQQLQAKRKSLSYGIKENAPTLRIIDQQIEDTRNSLIENIRNIQKNSNAAAKTLSGQIAGYESYLNKIPVTERELLAIKRKVEVNQGIYVYLLQKKAETSIAKATVVSDNKVLDEASLMDDPIAPNSKLIFALAVCFALITPVILIFIRNIFKATVSNREEISRLTDIPVIGVIGHLKNSDNLAVIHKPRAAIAEAFRSIRTNMQFLGLREQKRIILITSSVGGEGKSFVTINLASVLALQNHKVVMVGLDLRKPKLFQDFNLNNETGVSKFLIGQASMDEIIRNTTVPNLDLISSGPIPPNPAELISKSQMGDFFDELLKRYDYVIVDTPPIGIVSDALLLMNHSHINVYIIRENFSKHEFIRSLDEMYQEGKLKNISIILNDSDFRKSYGYGYGHNYGYMNGGAGYYGEESEKHSLLNRLFKKEKSGA